MFVQMSMNVEVATDAMRKQHVITSLAAMNAPAGLDFKEMATLALVGENLAK